MNIAPTWRLQPPLERAQLPPSTAQFRVPTLSLKDHESSVANEKIETLKKNNEMKIFQEDKTSVWI
jgi:hypothetical protein